MVWRLDPDLPVLWRSPSSLQVGLDPRVARADDLPRGAEHLVAALAAGVSPGGWDLAVQSAGVDADQAAELRAALAPALLADPPPRPVGPSPRATVFGDSALARAIAALLAEADALARDRATPDLAVLVDDWVLAPADSARFLRRDIPHLPVVTTDRAVNVGPLVEPGRGPCLHCVDLARRDDDPAWPALAAQVLGRRPRALTRLEVGEAAALAARAILRYRDGERHPAGDARPAWRLDRDGSVSERRWASHPECRCAALPGSDWAGAPRAAPAAPTTSSDASGLA